MPAPEGYTELDLVGFTDKGNYSAETTYAKNDLVHSSNKIYKSLQDNNTGQALPAAPEIATAYWEVWLSGGVDSTESLTAKDTDNLTGGGAGQVIIAQELLDAITAKVIKQLSSSDIVQTESTATNKVPSAAYLKEIKDGLDNDISELTSRQSKTYQNSFLDTNVICTRVGDIVMISFSGGVVSLPPNETVLFNLDAIYYPSSNVVLLCAPLTAATVQLTITTSGKVSFYNYGSNALTNSLRFYATYIAKN